MVLKKYGFKAQEILALEGDNNVIISNDDEEKFKINFCTFNTSIS